MLGGQIVSGPLLKSVLNKRSFLVYRKMTSVFGVLVIFVVCALVSLSWATGSTATVSWLAPTAYVDGTPMPPGDIASYTLSWSPKQGTPGASGSQKVDAGALSAVVTVPCGSTEFVMTVTTTATAVYPNATSSAAGPVTYVTGVSCAPNPPGALVVH